MRTITVRESTAAEREHAGDFWATGKPQKAERYVICDADQPAALLGAFGLVQGGETREEAVHWAERMASKNGFDFIRPKGWENVKGALPDD